MDNQEFYWRTLMKNVEWIKFSEAKAIFLLTLYGVIITIIYSNSKDIYTAFQSSGSLVFLTVLAVLMSCGSLIYCFLALNPVLKNNDPSSIIYFGHIRSKFKSSEEYRLHAEEVLKNEEQFIQNITEQIFQTSKIAWRKFKFISIGLRFFIAAIGFLIIEIGAYLSL
ncbi:Pycsar system effector family protein [Ekhidna sp.]|jgi:intracellular septation protein A|uniref:Pycsar system effector family protein n=1 Tax=Ekhidna sp. TaxID=2608089 RepID=UPI0032ED72CB